MRFSKPPKTFEEQVEILRSRGMEIDDSERAGRYLSHLNYYRLAAYWLPFEQNHSPHRFRPGTRFDTVLEHYIFDREFAVIWQLPCKKPSELPLNFNTADTRKLYNTLVMLAYLMDQINPHSWKKRLGKLFAKHPEVAERHMGFPEDWRDRPIWRDQTA